MNTTDRMLSDSDGDMVNKDTISHTVKGTQNRTPTAIKAIPMAISPGFKKYRFTALPPLLDYMLAFPFCINTKEFFVLGYLCTLPDPSPPASFSTSETLTRLKSPSMECFRADAATANSMAAWVDLPESRE